MYEIIKIKTDTENNIEARLAKIDKGYSIGAWDLDEKEYYPGLRIYPYELDNSYEKALAYFENYIK